MTSDCLIFDDLEAWVINSWVFTSPKLHSVASEWRDLKEGFHSVADIGKGESVLPLTHAVLKPFSSVSGSVR